MNWYYISGFFDADGSITTVKANQRCNKTLQISFHNNELSILESIRDYILEDITVSGSISKKRAKKESHSVGYDLKYTYQNAFKVSQKLMSIHPKKKHRIDIYEKIQESTKRNGRYTEQELNERNKLIEQFFKH